VSLNLADPNGSRQNKGLIPPWSAEGQRLRRGPLLRPNTDRASRLMFTLRWMAVDCDPATVAVLVEMAIGHLLRAARQHVQHASPRWITGVI
jgi:hypothetical protein